MTKSTETHLISNVAEETRYDVRLIEKKIQHGSMARQERDQYLKALKAETDYDFTSAETLNAEEIAS